MAVGIVLGNVLEGTFGTVALYIAAAVLLVIGLRSISHGMHSGDGGATASLSTRQIAATALVIAVDKLAVGLLFRRSGGATGYDGGDRCRAGVRGDAAGVVPRQAPGNAGRDAAEIIAGLVFTGLGLESCIRP